jgi:hypothetical protein
MIHTAPVSIKPRSGERIIVQPLAHSETPLRLRRLIIPRDIAVHFAISGLAFNKNNQLISPGAVPALLFANDALPENYDFDPLNDNDDITIEVTNLSNETKTFEAALLCDDNSQPIIHRRNFLGYGYTTVPSGGQCNVCVQPAYAFRGNRLVIPSTISEQFEVEGLKVGAYDQLRSGMRIPASLFTEKCSSNPIDWKLDVAAPSLFITIQVINTSSTAQNFCGALLGTALL